PALVQGLKDEYELICDVGKGALCAVYLARAIASDRHVAIKTLLPELGVHDSSVERFGRQAERAAKLRHANLLRVFDVRKTSEFTCMISEFIDGTSLAKVLQANGPIALDIAI